MTRLRLLVLVLIGTLGLSACDFDVYKLPLPGGVDTGEDPITVTVMFTDVLDLVPKSTVKVNDVSVGQVTDVSLEGYTARVTLELRNDVELPENTTAEIRQTSLLGEKFVSLAAPESGASGTLDDGDEIPLERSGRNPEVEEVLGALSLVLNGGGVAQLKTIASELNKALDGREDSARSVLTQVESLTSTLDENRQDIVDAIEKLNRLAVGVKQQQRSIDGALEQLPSALDSLNRQRDDLIVMLKALDDLSDVGVRVIKRSKDVTIDTVRQLQPVLTQLSNSGDDFVDAFNVFLTYPFVDEAVGRDPQVARNLHMGDYTNLSIQLDLDLSDLAKNPPQLPNVPGVPCTPLSQIPDTGPLPDLDTLCQGAQQAIQQCLDDPSLRNCQGLPGAVVDAVCQSANLPVLCGNGGGGGGGGGPLPTLPVPSVPGASLPPVTGNGGLLNRPGFGPGEVDPRGPTIGQLSQVYDPALVALLVPGVMTR